MQELYELVPICIHLARGFAKPAALQVAGQEAEPKRHKIKYLHDSCLFGHIMLQRPDRPEDRPEVRHCGL